MAKKTSKRRKFFPHFSLKKTAGLFKDLGLLFLPVFTNGFKIFILFSLFLFFFINLHSLFFPKNEKLSQIKKEVLKNPFSFKPHFDLASFFTQKENINLVEKELALATLFATSQDLDSLQELKEQIKNLKEKPAKIQKEIAFWEKIVSEKKDYRDAFLKLAVLSFQLDQKQKAKVYLEKALELDPNFEKAKELKQLIN